MLHRSSKCAALATFALIVAGGLVTSTGSGLSVPDWPLSYGTLNPPMIGGIRFEHTHRLIAGFVGLLTLVLAAAFRLKEKRRWVRHLALAAFLAVVAQALLGGATVLYFLPPLVSVAHACLAQTFFCLVVALAVVTSREWAEAPAVSSGSARKLRRLFVTTGAFAYAQLTLGALVRHGFAWAIGWHIAGAFLVLLHVLFMILRLGGDEKTPPGLSRHGVWLGVGILIQIFLGLGAFIFTRQLEPTQVPRAGEVFFATVHQAMGAGILGGLVALLLRYFRLVKPA